MIFELKRSFVRTTIMTVMLTMVALTLLLGAYIFLLDYQGFKNDIERIRHESLESRKEQIKNEVQRIVRFIEFGQHYHPDCGGEVKEEMANWANSVSFGNGGYIFILREDGMVLSGPDRGTDLLQSGYPEGVKVFNDLKKAAEKSEFIEYKMHRGDWTKQFRKLSYVEIAPSWRWIVGAGIFLDDIDKEVEAKRQELWGTVRMHLLTVLAVLIIIVFSVHVVFVFFTKWVNRVINAFLSFFENAATRSVRMSPESFYFSEMSRLAESANRMIDERSRFERAISEEKERLAVTLASIGDGVITTDTDGRIVLLNAAAEQMTGWHSADAVGLPLDAVFRIVMERTRKPAVDPVKKVLESGRVEALANSTMLLARDGRELIIEDSAAPIRDRDGRIIGVVLVFRDNTQKRQYEEETRRAQRIESLGLLAGGIAHDFNNYLTGIMGSLSLSKYLADPGHKMHEVLAKAEQATIRAKHLTGQLLTFAKGGHPVRRPVDIRKVLNECVSFSLAGSPIRADVLFADDLRVLTADEGQLMQLFNNLLINAVQAMNGVGTVMIRARNAQGGEMAGRLGPGQYIAVTVADTGPGIAPEHLAHIFDPYFTTKPDGTGLGLAVAYSILSRHGGVVTVDSTVGQGTTFTVFLPIEADAAPLAESRAEEVRTGSGRVLVMDDDEVIRQTIGSMLRYLGYDPVLVPDGREALERYRRALEERQPFDLVILDLTVPGGMGGEEAIGELKKLDPQVRAVVSTGYSHSPVTAQYERYGFVGILPKPYNIEDIGRLAASLIRSR
ncbi:MAG TPA: cache domain-containing protein [bacterium]|nr:cache domain-containing protein [bacterium]